MSDSTETRNIVLENQIETMIENVIGDDNKDGLTLKFSDDENSTGSPNRKPNGIPINKIKTENNQQQVPYLRNSRKHQTVSYISNPPLIINNLNLYRPQPQHSSFMYDCQINPYHNYQMAPNFQPRTNMFYINNNNNPHFQYDNTNIIQSMQQQQQHIPQHIMQPNNNFNFSIENNNNNTINTNVNLNNINNLINQQIKTKTVKPQNSSSLLRQKTQIKHKKFGTTALPQGINMKIELLLYEMNTALSKTDKIDHFIYAKLQNNFTPIIQTHKGSRIFQNYLKNTHSEIIHLIFNEISLSLSILMKDSYANYFCKKLFLYLNQKDKIDFLLQDAMFDLSTNSIGTYPIQGIIDQVGSKAEKFIIISSIQDKISELAYDTYGTHVLEKIMTCFEEELTRFICEFALNNFLSLAYHHNGICIIKIILSLTYKTEIINNIKTVIKENALELIQHSCGNYVIQGIVEHWDMSNLKEIFQLFTGNYVLLSIQKYSSNVVERCIEKSPDTLEAYIIEISHSQRIGEVMKSNYGNYVIQKALKIATVNTEALFARSIMENIHKLEDKKLMQKWSGIVAPYIDKVEMNYDFNNSANIE